MADFWQLPTSTTKPTYYKYMPTDDTVLFGLSSPGDIQREQAAGLREAGIAAGIGAAGTLAQLGLSYIPTAQDKQNEERLDALAKHKGLTQGERAEIDEQSMRGVRAFAAENQKRDEALLAGMGSTDVGALTRSRREGDRQLNQASIQAANIGIQAEREKVAQDIAEEERRLSYKSGKQDQRINLGMKTIEGLAEQAGPVISAQATGRDVTDAQLLAMQRARNPDGGKAYPGFSDDMSIEALRATYEAMWKSAREGRKDGATVAP